MIDELYDMKRIYDRDSVRVKGVTYDDTEHKVSVKVEDADKDLALEAVVTYENSESETSATITNTYVEEKEEEETDKDTDSEDDTDDEDIEEEDLDVGTRESDVSYGVRTGDESSISFWIAMTAAAAAAFVTIAAFRRRSE